MSKNDRLFKHLNMSMTGNIMTTDISWFRIIFSGNENLNTSMHKHIVHELQYVYSGCLPILIGQKILSIKAGEYALIPAGIQHKVISPDVPTRKLVIGFSIESDDLYAKNTYNHLASPVFQTATPVFQQLADVLVEKYSASYISTPSASAMSCILHILLLEITDQISSADQIQAMTQPAESYQRFNQILSFINERAFNNISIQDVADNLSLSVRQTSRICHNLFGCTINQLISQIRIQQICFLLTRSDNSISKIAEMAGFSNPYTFSRFFSHQTGVSPSTYRKNYEIKKE